MNREIKFRAWDDGKMYQEAMVGEPANPSVYTDAHWRECTEKVVLMQFTGLKDKNGKEIYESDVLEFNYPMEVVWDMGSWAVKTTKGSSLLYGYTVDGEVIGNVYENPELLNQ